MNQLQAMHSGFWNRRGHGREPSQKKCCWAMQTYQLPVFGHTPAKNHCSACERKRAA